jgi:hypothetical protein
MGFWSADWNMLFLAKIHRSAGKRDESWPMKRKSAHSAVVANPPEARPEYEPRSDFGISLAVWERGGFWGEGPKLRPRGDEAPSNDNGQSAIWEKCWLGRKGPQATS